MIIPEGQLADVLPDELVEALGEEGPSVALDPRWKAARDAFLASMDAEWGSPFRAFGILPAVQSQAACWRTTR